MKVTDCQELSIPYYEHGYNLKVNSCINYTISGAAGKFNKNNYDLYNALWCLYSNYRIEQNDKRKVILHKLGLELEEIAVDCFENCIEHIKASIDQGFPAFFPTNFKCLFFRRDDYESLKEGGYHWLLFSGYENSTQRFILRDFAVNEKEFRFFTSAHIFSVYFVTKEIFQDIYNRTEKLFLYENYKYLKKIYSMRPISFVEPYTNEMLLNDYISMAESKENKFTTLIRLFKNLNMTERELILSRSAFQFSYEPLFIMLERLLFSYVDEERNRNYDNLKHVFLEARNTVLSLMHKCIITDTYSDKLCEYIDIIEENDRQMLDYIKSVIKNTASNLK